MKFSISLSRVLLVAVCLFPLLPITPAKAQVDPGFVTVQGTQFRLGGEQFRFVGFNLFDAAATESYKCASWDRFSDSELDAAIKYMRDHGGASVLRFWAFQKYTNGGTDWSGIDRVINIAKANGIKVIPVLENGQSHCTGQATAKYNYEGDTWYTDGYKEPFGTDPLSYRDYVQLIVDRYKDEPAILGWMMMNEADTSAKNGSGQSVLVDFATDIGALIKGIDSNHLLTVGTQSNGASGASGQDFIDVYSLPTIDFAEGHDWGYWGSDTDPLPGADEDLTLPDPESSFCLQTYQNKIACSIAQSLGIVGKPFVIGESGIAATNAGERQTRANLIEDKMLAAFSNGVSGYLIWQFNRVMDTENFDVLSTTNDPLFDVLLSFANDLGSGPDSEDPDGGNGSNNGNNGNGGNNGGVTQLPNTDLSGEQALLLFVGFDLLIFAYVFIRSGLSDEFGQLVAAKLNPNSAAALYLKKRSFLRRLSTHNRARLKN
jgi:mannan endo-1,4-beta-mannosidase